MLKVWTFRNFSVGFRSDDFEERVVESADTGARDCGNEEASLFVDFDFVDKECVGVDIRETVVGLVAIRSKSSPLDVTI